MMNVIFTVLMIIVFFKLIKIAFKLSWGIIKIIGTFIFLPFILIGLVIAGFMSIVIAALIVIGISTLIISAIAA